MRSWAARKDCPGPAGEGCPDKALGYLGYGDIAAVQWCPVCFPGELEAGFRDRLLAVTCAAPPPKHLLELAELSKPRLVVDNPAPKGPQQRMEDYAPLPRGGLFGPREVR